MHKIITFTPEQVRTVTELIMENQPTIGQIIELEKKRERQRVCEIILKYIVPPDNDGYWANDLLKDIINQIRG